MKARSSFVRLLKVALASYPLAFGFALLLATGSLPFFGYQGFDLLFDQPRGWPVLGIAAIAFPFVQRWLK